MLGIISRGQVRRGGDGAGGRGRVSGGDHDGHVDRTAEGLAGGVLHDPIAGVGTFRQGGYHGNRDVIRVAGGYCGCECRGSAAHGVAADEDQLVRGGPVAGAVVLDRPGLGEGLSGGHDGVIGDGDIRGPDGVIAKRFRRHHFCGSLDERLGLGGGRHKGSSHLRGFGWNRGGFLCQDGQRLRHRSIHGINCGLGFFFLFGIGARRQCQSETNEQDQYLFCFHENFDLFNRFQALIKRTHKGKVPRVPVHYNSQIYEFAKNTL